MNEHFVNVKVDREERPDVDALYMDATVSMTGQGGWPMTVFLTPTGEPFYAGTYFPPEPRHGLPSFAQLLLAVAEAWETQRDDIVTQARRLVDAASHSARIEPSADPLTAALLDEAERGIARTFEPVLRRLRAGAEVPARLEPRVPPPPRLARGDGDGDEDARRDGRRRDVRPRRWRLPSLLGRRAVARAALREDALRQRAARLHVPARLRRHGGAALPRDRRGDARLRGARAAAARRRPRLGAGRRHERRRGPHVHVDGGGGRAGRAAAALRARPLDHPRLSRPGAPCQAARRA